ncbi:MFS transporter [Lederbergia lenta]|uniref:Putative sugar efflux transporter (Major Facilitator family) n=1 Tax=Lederbergia lenta TaxID=1467 RepID=A0A2X4VTV7_LEDLE|nr:MFS transporter [Lederbergia lenta]MCM3110825.1 MFS transporter [Lederbergia lenta]MEC2325780.1 MFS transporter [Lederbergia lenta]SQI53759.1 putative sugar efflux transporter (Major Facilitator family) [Lederbergia lenta]
MNIIGDIRSFLKIKGAWFLLLGLFLYGIGTGILAPMNAVYMSEGIGLSKGEIASIFGISVVLNMVITILIGFISDKMQRKKPLPIFALMLCMFGLIVYMQADTYMGALVGMVITIAPSGLIMGQLFAMARNHFMQLAPSIYEIAQIWLRAMMSVGFFVGLLVGANLYLVASFKGILIGNFFGYFFLFLLLLFYKEFESVESDATTTKGETFSFIMLFALLLLGCADSLRGLYLPLVVVDLFEKPQLMSYLWSVQAVFELLFMTFAGYWAMKFGSKRVILLSSFCAVITYIIYSTSPPLFVFFLVQPLYSFYVSVLYGVAMGYVQRMFHAKIGFGSSVYVFLFQMASLVGYVLPFLIEGYKPQIFIIPSVLVAGGILLMVGLVIFSRRKQMEMTM